MSSDLEIVLLSYEGINSAAKAFADASERASASASWPRQVGFVEHHHNGHLVLRGTFAGRYVDVDEALHVSEHGAAEGGAIGAAIGILLGPPGIAVGLASGIEIGSQRGRTTDADPEPQPLTDRLRAEVPRSASAIVLIADAQDVDELLGSVDQSRARVIRTALTADAVAALEASLSAWPMASAGPSVEGEEAAEESEAERA
jgi:uncharacterized membrane protein